MLRACAAVVAVAVVCQQPAPPRPLILGVAHVRLLSSDLAKSRAFYGTLLGFSEVPQSNGMVAILSDRGLHRRVASAASRVVRERFCAERVVPMYEAHYERALRKGNR